MSLKSGLALVWKTLVLIAIYFVIDMVSRAVIPMRLDWAPPADQLPLVFGGMLLVAAVNSLVISLVVLRSTWSGWRLVAAVAVAWYGTMTVMAQIEAYWFAPSLGIARSVPPSLALQELPIVLVVSSAAAFLWGRAKPATSNALQPVHLPSSAVEWLGKSAIIAASYLVLYFGFGYVVAWQNPALREMYANGSDPVVFNYAYLIPLQIVRSALWVLFAIPVMRMSRGSTWHIALLIGLLFALPMNIGHAIPNPIMPDPSVRLSHFIETATSNFLFGIAVTWVLSWRPGFLPIRSVPAARL